jgi:type I restriction enzyme S subunit
MTDDELVGEAPSGWQYTTLGAACEGAGGDIQTGPFGSQLHASDYVSVGIPSIMPQNIGDNRIIEDRIAHIASGDAKRLNRYLVRKGDIVYSRRGDVERRALVREREDGWLCGTGCLRIRLGEKGVDPRYASFYLAHPGVCDWIVRHAHGATMPNLNTSILAACPFLVPPPEEQRRIARILGAFDDKIELNRRMNETLEAIARALFKSSFVDLDAIRTLADVADLNPESWTPTDYPAEIRYVDLSNTKWGVIQAIDIYSDATAPSRAQRVLRTGDTIVGTVRPGNGSFAMIGENGLTGSTGFAVLRPRQPHYREFVYCTATSEENIERLSHLADGAAYPAVRPEVVAATELPSFEEDAVLDFSAATKPIFDRIGLARRESENLTAIRDLLLPKLVSGELRLHEVEKVIEEHAA